MDTTLLNEILVNNIRKICKNKKVPISQLEIDLGFSPGLISRWSRTKTSPAFDKIVAVMEYLGVTYEELTSNDKAKTVNFPSGSRNQKQSLQNNIYETLLKNTKDGNMMWNSTGDKLPENISLTDDLFTDWYQYDMHKYYFTLFKQSIMVLIIEYNTRTCYMYNALYTIHYQLDGSTELVLEQDRRLTDLLHYIDADDYHDLCEHYKKYFSQSYVNHDYTNESKFKKI
ncbi:helix-turn-helix transcriptional regulator [Mediterraneibacter glycyrrhizinilyticus]|uniref:helix-turn-helix domain-containing protein n=1 Tax=Mediterraneibacter glycyrrhizinilyticus TaxID=342942 RepID=UPI00265A3104|nr:helix-turn-helix transcriptional regulator [Mediterraneibacter glycyrrhizinilyticus]MCF2569078.1 helix-turn-helix transcriptional regulator [Mediterraneibacter glycyrrhizinilyticus]